MHDICLFAKNPCCKNLDSAKCEQFMCAKKSMLYSTCIILLLLGDLFFVVLTTKLHLECLKMEDVNAKYLYRKKL